MERKRKGIKSDLGYHDDNDYVCRLIIKSFRAADNSLDRAI